MGFTPVDRIWFNGKLVPWGEAKVHVLAHALHYGTGVFEGMRCYPTAEGPAVFRLDAHLERFYASAALYDLTIPYSTEALVEATHEVIRENRLESAYIRPIAFFDAATLSVWTKECPVTVAIAAFPTGQYHAGGPDHGVRVTISPIRKFDNSAMPAWAKACGQYINSARAVNDAQRRGVEELLGADELFSAGTAVGVAAVTDVPGHPNGDGKAGAVTRSIQVACSQAVRGQVPQHRRWVSYVRQEVRA